LKKSNSITVIGKRVQHAYVIKDIDVDKVTIEKYDVECRNTIDDAWRSNIEDQTLEIILKEKISNITLNAKANVIETVVTMGGKIIRDIKVEKAKRGNKVYLIDVEFFEEPYE